MVSVFDHESLVGAECPLVAAGDYFVTYQHLGFADSERWSSRVEFPKTREVPLPDSVATAISERLRHWPIHDGLVFTTRERGLMDRRYFNRHIWKPALEAVDVEPTRENGMHALRHYYASTLLEGGVSIRAVADYLGHSDPGFTLRVYAHLMPESEERARTVVDMSLSAAAESSRNDRPGHVRFVN